MTDDLSVGPTFYETTRQSACGTCLVRLSLCTIATRAVTSWKENAGHGAE